MLLFPAIDLYDGCAVRLTKGDYARMDIYSHSPAEVAKSFEQAGAEYLHVVDLAGARDGDTPNAPSVKEILSATSLKVEIGGGIRDEAVVRRYLDMGVERVILGTAALTDPAFLKSMVDTYGKHISVGVDLKDGFVAIKGWTEVSKKSGEDFCRELENMGVSHVICTDISKDGVLAGTNRELYARLSSLFRLDITASGGISSLADVLALKEMGLYGAILGKALYTGKLDLAEAVRKTREERS